MTVPRPAAWPETPAVAQWRALYPDGRDSAITVDEAHEPYVHAVAATLAATGIPVERVDFGERINYGRIAWIALADTDVSLRWAESTGWDFDRGDHYGNTLGPDVALLADPAAVAAAVARMLADVAAGHTGGYGHDPEVPGRDPHIQDVTFEAALAVYRGHPGHAAMLAAYAAYAASDAGPLRVDTTGITPAAVTTRGGRGTVLMQEWLPDAIWAGVVLAVAVLAAARLGGPAAALLRARAEEAAVAVRERAVAADERAVQVALDRATAPEREAARRAQLAVEAAEDRAAAEVAAGTVPARTEEALRLIRERGDLERSLLADTVRADLARRGADGDMKHLAEAYAAYCTACGEMKATPARWESWAPPWARRRQQAPPGDQ